MQVYLNPFGEMITEESIISNIELTKFNNQKQVYIPYLYKMNINQQELLEPQGYSIEPIIVQGGCGPGGMIIKW